VYRSGDRVAVVLLREKPVAKGHVLLSWGNHILIVSTDKVALMLMCEGISLVVAVVAGTAQRKLGWRSLLLLGQSS
jgi:hypothetical protein